jgi:hypothetical protein
MAAQTEQDLINAAYGDAVRNLYQVFAQAYTAALGAATGQQQAEANFQRGITHARHVRDRAIALIPPQ